MSYVPIRELQIKDCAQCHCRKILCVCRSHVHTTGEALGKRVTVFHMKSFCSYQENNCKEPTHYTYIPWIEA